MDFNKIQKIVDETKDVSLVVASKYIDYRGIKELYDFGLRNFGENRVEAFLIKENLLRNLDIKWHFIGHLQTNKAIKIIDKIDVLHSLDSIKLAGIIERHRENKLDTFIEVHMTDSDTKNGIRPKDLGIFLEDLKKYPKVNVIGLMTMTEKDMSDEEKLFVFKKLKSLGEKYNLKNFSMGMSEDYKLAIEAGATHIRLGRIICE